MVNNITLSIDYTGKLVQNKADINPQHKYRYFLVASTRQLYENNNGTLTLVDVQNFTFLDQSTMIPYRVSTCIEIIRDTDTLFICDLGILLRDTSGNWSVCRFQSSSDSTKIIDVWSMGGNPLITPDIYFLGQPPIFLPPDLHFAFKSPDEFAINWTEIPINQSASFVYDDHLNIRTEITFHHRDASFYPFYLMTETGMYINLQNAPGNQVTTTSPAFAYFYKDTSILYSTENITYTLICNTDCNIKVYDGTTDLIPVLLKPSSIRRDGLYGTLLSSDDHGDATVDGNNVIYSGSAGTNLIMFPAILTTSSTIVTSSEGMTTITGVFVKFNFINFPTGDLGIRAGDTAFDVFWENVTNGSTVVVTYRSGVSPAQYTALTMTWNF